MSIKQEASSAEWEVMKVIWTLKEPTSRSVSQVLKDTMDWENATTKTLLGRLVKKGYLKTHKDGNRFIYEALISEEDGVNNRLLDAADTFCTKARGRSIANLIDHLQLSYEDRDLIMQAMNNKEFKKSLDCTCLTGCQCQPGQCHCGHSHN